MALIIEDGSGVANATSYVTEEEATAFLEIRGRNDWPGDEAEQRKFIVRAGDYLNTFYHWGAGVFDDQGMAIPTLVLDYVPQPVKTAQILLAYEASKGDELADGAVTGPSIVKTRKKLDGVGEKEIEYGDDAPLGGRRFPAVDTLLAGIGIITNASSASSGSIQVSRRLVG